MTVYGMVWDGECVNQIGSFPQFFTTSVANFNTTYADAAVAASSGSTSTVVGLHQEQELLLSAPIAEFWFHASLYVNAFTAADTGELLRLRSNTGNELRLRGNATGAGNDVSYRWEKTLNGTTWTQVGATSYLMRALILNQLDINIKMHAATGTIKTYLNSVLVFTFTGDVSTLTNTVNSILLGNTFTNGGVAYWSEVVVADEPTFDWHVHTLPVTASGANSAWTGTFADVDEAGIAYNDVNSTDVVNNIQTYNFTDTVSTLMTGNQIKALGIASKTAITVDAIPADMQHAVRTGGTNFFSANLGIPKDANYVARTTLYNTNPNTAAQWTSSEVNAAEVGMKAV